MADKRAEIEEAVKEEIVNAVYLRQLDILNKKYFDIPICIIGAGATGSFAALALSKMGMRNIKIWDHDKIETHNFPNQLFRMKDLDNYKSEKTAEIIKDFTDNEITFFNEKYESQELSGIVILAVDSMECRKKIYERCLTMPRVKYIIDPRCGSEQYRVYTVDMAYEMCRTFYEKFFYLDSETDPTPCTAQAIIYSVFFAVGTIALQIKMILMDQDYKKEIIADLPGYMFLTR